MIAGASAQGSRWATVTLDAVLEGCDVDLVGVPTRLAATDRRAAGALAALLRYAPPASSRPRVTVRVVSQPLPVPLLVSASFGSDIETWRPQRGVLVIRHRRGGPVAHVTADEIVIGHNAPAFVTTFRHVLVLALAHALAQHGRQVVHAGAIARGGRAVLVLGGSGAGKSTLALCALRRGWRVLGDDLVAVQLRDGDPYVAGIPRPIVVPRDVLGADAPASSGRGDPRERSELLAVAPHVGWHPVVGSLLATHAAEPRARLDRLDGPERLRLVLGACLAMGDPAVLREVFTLAAAVARRPGVALQHSRDPRTRLADGMRVLEDARASIGLAD